MGMKMFRSGVGITGIAPKTFGLAIATAAAANNGPSIQGKGIPAELISYASYGPHAPKGSKSQSRRVELVVLVE